MRLVLVPSRSTVVRGPGTNCQHSTTGSGTWSLVPVFQRRSGRSRVASPSVTSPWLCHHRQAHTLIRVIRLITHSSVLKPHCYFPIRVTRARCITRPSHHLQRSVGSHRPRPLPSADCIQGADRTLVPSSLRARATFTTLSPPLLLPVPGSHSTNQRRPRLLSSDLELSGISFKVFRPYPVLSNSSWPLQMPKSPAPISRKGPTCWSAILLAPPSKVLSGINFAK